MKLTVFGASGGTGSQVVTQALDAGHEVLAVVRNPARLRMSHPNLTVMTADVLQPAEIGDAVVGRDAVISALGHSRRRAERKAAAHPTLCADSARSITEAMRATGSRRLVIVSASGPYTDGDGPVLRSVIKPIVGRLLKDAWADFVAMEEVVRASGLDWTVLRPPAVTGVRDRADQQRRDGQRHQERDDQVARPEQRRGDEAADQRARDAEQQ